MLDDIVYQHKSSKLKFCLCKQLGFIYLDMSNTSIWSRLFKKKEIVLWEQDIENLRKMLKEYDSIKIQNHS
jgi:hypothetical protein